MQPDHPSLSICCQAELIGISRSSLYYASVVSAEDVRTMNALDEIFTVCPFYGSRRMVVELGRTHEIRICRDCVRRLMRAMGLAAIYPKKYRGSEPNLQHQHYPYLLTNLTITTPNQVWGTDITYVRLRQGFCYLVALIDWFSRYVVSWELSQTLHLDFCLNNLHRALAVATPDIHNSDQGSHFTSPAYTSLLAEKNIHISMDGRGRCMDNIFTERLWRTVKYTEVYVHDYQSFADARQSLRAYFRKYNERRLCSAIGMRTPAEAYFQN